MRHAIVRAARRGDAHLVKGRALVIGCALGGCGPAALQPAATPPSIAIEPSSSGDLEEPLVATNTASHAPPAELGELDDYPECAADGPSVQRVDVNGDGSTDMFHVRRNGTRACSGVDVDLDGMLDQLTLYDDAGQPRLVLRDLDGNGRFDSSEHYVNGVCVSRSADHDGDGASDRTSPCR
jgi:hypothetical protein